MYSSSILLVYDASRLKLQLHRQKSLNSSPCQSPKRSPSSPMDTVEPPLLYKQIQRSHSFTNNYEQDIEEMRENYNLMLGSLVDETVDDDWVYARMIDFAHVFPAEEQSVDTNYLQGIESLVKIFEDFLKECE
jgi:1D-myo-inositol-tetrakisphosphate 5-kinase/inositol-polyphosphate multikinase